jgi:hypothetical protein
MEEVFVKLIEEAYIDESLKEVAKRVGPECARKANETAKRKQRSTVLKMHQHEAVTALFLFVPPQNEDIPAFQYTVNCTQTC